MSETRKVPTWKVVECPDERLVGRSVQAWTKGEARAALRDQLGLEYLPCGMVLAREGGEG